MEPVAAALAAVSAELYRAAPPQPPQCLWASTTTGRLVTAEEVSRPSFASHWATHAREVVDFPAAMESLVAAHASSCSATQPPAELRLVEMGEGMLVRFCKDLSCTAEMAAEGVAVLPRAECYLDGPDDVLLCTDQACVIEAAIARVVEGQTTTTSSTTASPRPPPSSTSSTSRSAVAKGRTEVGMDGDAAVRVVSRAQQEDWGV